ncbi:hypothetical protein A2U01_0021073 [Trifolium medium]|uniref:Uncharacterized protein n=1 Tax=Trifolium medium TaxID=97028 RepID=A0A392NJH2_9FABA|nr:hypothetical protein [Trifolium medium]
MLRCGVDIGSGGDYLYSNLAGFWNWNVIEVVLNEGDEQEVHNLITAIDVEEEDRLYGNSTTNPSTP